MFFLSGRLGFVHVAATEQQAARSEYGDGACTHGLHYATTPPGRTPRSVAAFPRRGTVVRVPRSRLVAILVALLVLVAGFFMLRASSKVGDDAQTAAEPSQVAAGFEHSCATFGAELRCWGLNSSGQLGVGSFDLKLAPTPVLGLEDVKIAKIVAGLSYTCLRSVDSAVWCWGDMVVEATATPVLVAGVKAVDLAAGYDHVCALDDTGSVWCWGDNSLGQLGVGSFEKSRTPVRVDLAAPATAITADEVHSCAAIADGSMWCWGINEFGQLGDGSKENSTVPVQVKDLPITPIAVAAGSTHTCAMSPAEVYCWGNNQYNEIGPGRSIVGLPDEVPSPRKVSGLDPAVAIEAGQDHTCVRTAAGKVQCWGAYWEGQLGTGDQENMAGEVVTVPNLTGEVHQLAVGSDHNCVGFTTGGVQCWGLNKAGQVGTAQDLVSAVSVISSGFSSVELGASNACALTAAGELFCWGAYRATASDSDTARTPTRVAQIKTPVAEVAMGYSHRCARTTEGKVYCWGSSNHGESAAEGFVPEPALVQGLPSEVRRVFTGDYHTCALAPDDRLYCWGKNQFGELGTGDTESSTTPRLTTIGSVKQLAMGEDHSCAVRADGSVWCWGSNEFGQLGDGGEGSSLVPVRVDLSGPVQTLVSGRHHLCALLEEGPVWCWGRNNYSQLGAASFGEKSRPVRVPDLIGVRSISSGKDHTCVVVEDGSVWCWGPNWNGQLGNGNIGDATTPKKALIYDDRAVSVHVRGEYTCASTEIGGLKCWGSNVSGQLGNGRTSVEPSPTKVDPFAREPQKTPSTVPPSQDGDA